MGDVFFSKEGSVMFCSMRQDDQNYKSVTKFESQLRGKENSKKM